MGIRSAEWWRPDLPLTAARVAYTYADFAPRILRG